MKRKTAIMLAALVGSVVWGMGQTQAQAALATLTSAASQANISYGIGTTNLDAYSSANPRSGVYFLYRDGGVDKIQDAVQQTYFYRVGSEGPVNEINSGATSVSRLDNGMTASLATLMYAYNGFTIKTVYGLSGSNVGGYSNTLMKSVRITNTGSSSLNMSFWSYSDYTLTGVSSSKPTPGDPYADNNSGPQGLAGYEFAQVVTPKSVKQWDTYGSASGTHISELSNTYGGSVSPVMVTTGLGGGTSNTNGLLYNLVNGPLVSNPLTGGTNSGIATDVAFAAQWDLALAPGGVVTISDVTSIVPEPASLGMLLVGAGLLFFGRRKNA